MTLPETIDQAVRLHREGDLSRAAALYARVLREDPTHVDALHLAGVVHHQRKEYVQAERCYREAVNLRPAYPAALTNLGLLLAETGRTDEALLTLREAVRLDPSHAPAQVNLGFHLNRCSRFEEGAAACREALAVMPEAADVWCNLGVALHGLNRPAEAEEAFSRALALRPAYPAALNNLGNLLAERDDSDGAFEAYRNAAAFDPSYGSPLNNMAKLLRERGDLAGAEEFYRKALALNPQSAESHWGLAHVLLLQGRFAEGWKEYEWRWALPDAGARRPHRVPLWYGESVAGKRILLCAEQGLGDALHFIRYAEILAAQGATVVVEAPQPLVRLLRYACGISAVVAAGAPAPPCDVFAPLLSLPALLQDEARGVPASVPYIHVPADTISAWASRLAGDPAGYRVGIVWAGSPTHENDRRRSCPSGCLVPLLKTPGARFYSLQAHTTDPLPQEWAGRVIDHMAYCSDVLETAGLILQMDLVVTVDTMVAHLAGALGKPVWVLLPFAPDWRWMVGTEQSPWYPSMRLMRQERPGEWDGVIGRTVRDLESVFLHQAVERHRDGDRVGAEAVYQEILASHPSTAEARYLLGVLCQETGRRKEALDHSRQVLAIEPGHAGAWNTIGICLQQEGDLAGAEDAYRHALGGDPSAADARYNLGSSLCAMGRLEEAERELRQAIADGADRARAANNLGLVLYRQGNSTEAIDWYRRSLSASPGLVDAHWNLAHALLHTGHWDQGWKEFEWRWRKPEFRSLAASYRAPRWTGGRLDGRRLLVWMEQGFGDAIFFLRFLPALLDRGGTVLVEAPVPLCRLVQQMSHEIVVIPRGAPLPDHDFQIPLLSLPGLPGMRPAADGRPYLHPDPDEFSRWDARLTAFGHRVRVGIVWAGSATNAEGRYRSIPPGTVREIGTVPSAVFVNLQKGEAAGAFASVFPPEAGVDWSDELPDFGSTAALIAALDLVITVDTAVAHLAGALGKDVWVLLSRPHDWRYGEDGDAAAWYSSMRVFRQHARGEWGGVVHDVAEALREYCSFTVSANRGVTLLQDGRPAQARRELERAVALNPAHAQAHLNLAFALLVTGDWERGLTEYEWRLETDAGHPSRRPYEQPRWRGEEVNGKVVFLYAEQGFGDTIHGARYARLLADRGATVVLECRRELRRLMQTVPGVQAVIVRGEDPPPFDVHAPLLSLPLLFGTTPSTIPGDVPYIRPPDRPLTEFADLPETPKGTLRVGLVWAGNPVCTVDGERSLSLQAVLSHLPSDGALYVSIQKGGPAADGQRFQGSHLVVEVGERLEDFFDTACLLKHLDVILTVDTAAAHLAGAMALPVITLLPAAPDWRWLLGRTESGWYPTMRLVRQSRRGVWETALLEAAQILKDRIREHANRD